MELQRSLSAETKLADAAFKALKSSKSASIVVCGSNDTSVQILANKLNSVIGAYNKTINLNNPVRMFMSNDEAMAKFAKQLLMERKQVQRLFSTEQIQRIHCQTVISSQRGLKGIKMTISLAQSQMRQQATVRMFVQITTALEAVV